MSIDFRSAGHSGDESNHYYRQSTAPTTGDPLQVGDLWSDTTANLLKRCTSIAPVTFVSVEGGSAAHNLFSSTHGDVDETDTPTDGQILKYNSAAAKWRAENEAAGSGESNTASNVNVGGIGVFKQKTGVDLEFRGIIADSSKISVTLDAPNNEVGLDVVEANLTLSNIGGSVTDGQIPAAIARDSELHNQSHGAADHSGAVIPGGNNEDLGAAFLDVDQIAAPANPAAGTRRVFVDTADGKIKVRTSGGISVSLEEQGGGVTFAVPTGDIDIGDAAAEGASGNATRADHQHAFGAPGAGYPVDVAAAEADGAATTPARSDHVHAHGSGYLPDAHHTKYTAAEAIAAVEGEATLLLSNVTLPGSAAPTPTVEGSLEWDTDNDKMVVGDSVGQKIFTPTSAMSGEASQDTGGAVTVAGTHAGSSHHNQDHAARHADGGADELAVQDLASDAATDGQLAKADGAGAVAFEDDQVVINFIIDGGGSAITTGVKGFVKMPFAVTVTGWNILADQTGSIVVDVWAEDEALSPPTVADTIAGTEKPTLATAQKNEDLALTTWTNIAAGDWVGFNVDSITTVERVTVAIRGKKT